jgi:aryl-phospho-beta-D-glucosidase BglC (GH1 family)
MIQFILRFVLERWITPSPFRSAAAPGQSDLHVATGADARQILEHHWGNWIKDEDWQWIVDHGYNTVRIPVSLAKGMLILASHSMPRLDITIFAV